MSRELEVSTVALLFPPGLPQRATCVTTQVAACVQVALILSLESWAIHIPILETHGRQKQRFLKDSMTIVLSFYCLPF